jgi:hypothetical protein
MPHILTVDLNNLQANEDNYKVISFPSRVKVSSMSFSINGAAAMNQELDRVWRLYAWSGHPTPTVENAWAEWTAPIFTNDAAKPVLDNATAAFASTIGTPLSELVPVSGTGAGVLKFEYNAGIFAPGDYMVLWVENIAGDISEIVWEDTEATINIVYEETAAMTPYELTQKYPFL